jgi:uncharacterized protein (TIGR02118 family)
MVVFTVLYPYGPGKRFDMDYYVTKHLALVKEKVGAALKAVSVDKGLSGPAPGSDPAYAAICRLVFASAEDVATHLAPHDATFAADVPNFTDIQPEFQISELVLQV